MRGSAPRRAAGSASPAGPQALAKDTLPFLLSAHHLERGLQLRLDVGARDHDQAVVVANDKIPPGATGTPPNTTGSFTEPRSIDGPREVTPCERVVRARSHRGRTLGRPSLTRRVIAPGFETVSMPMQPRPV